MADLSILDTASPRLLTLLEKQHPPTLYKRAPLWDLTKADTVPPKSVFSRVHLPTWNWTYQPPVIPEEGPDELVTLDANAAYISAASTVSIAHSGLDHTGPQTRFYGLPGYYLLKIDPDAWTDPRIVHPLGDRITSGYAWLPQPTMTLLAELSRPQPTGFPSWPELEILDSWTCTAKGRLTGWTDAVRDLRAELILAGDRKAYERFKVSYSQAIQMLRGHDEEEEAARAARGDKPRAKSRVRRPDWNDAIRAQSYANIWRKAWRSLVAGSGPVAMGDNDTITFGMEALQALQLISPPPVRLDQTGLSLGTFKVVKVAS